jgi:hypothetical protein
LRTHCEPWPSLDTRYSWPSNDAITPTVATGIPATSRPIDHGAGRTGADGFVIDPAIHI